SATLTALQRHGPRTRGGRRDEHEDAGAPRRPVGDLRVRSGPRDRLRAVADADPLARAGNGARTMAKTKSLYSVHPGFEMEAGYRKTLRARTGKTYEKWVEITKKTGPPTEKERRAWLKEKHGHTTNYAWWIAEGSEGTASGAEGYEPEAYVEAMFAG